MDAPTLSHLPPPHRLIPALALLLAWAGLCLWQWQRHRRAAAPVANLSVDEGGPQALVTWASQTGAAEALAWDTARALESGGLPARVAPLEQLDPDQLRQHQPVLFVASTAGDGQAPDHAEAFVDRWMDRPAELAGLPCGVLALGDREYRHFCGFGQQLQRWLHDSGAQPLFEPVLMDRGDPQALQHWLAAVGALTPALPPAAPSAPPPRRRSWARTAAPGTAHEPWILLGRRHLNPGSLGEPVWLIDIAPPLDRHTPPSWEAGDLVQLRLPGTDRTPRSYSIASLPDAGLGGGLQLLVRRHRREDGGVGAASGWLTGDCPIGGALSLRIQPNPAFRLPPALADRPLVLIGNGTGLAGLRAHLQAAERRLALPDSPRQRLVTQGRHAWLLLGERQAAHDALCDVEITHWLASGVLSRTDRVYSRDGGPHRHVQERLAAEAPRLRDWVEAGAVILLCGSRQGMASGVEASLSDALGEAALRSLRQQGRLRRDVY
jgi:sulfite reductase (NADPH) flavoprotein alpha-component